MSTSEIIRQKVIAMNPDKVFSYRDFGFPPEANGSVLKSLSRMANRGILTKLSNGRYYKPKQTVFGTLSPSQDEIVKDLLVQGRRTVGYLTGLSIFNRLGLTSQVANIIQIGCNVKRNMKKRGIYTIKFVVQPNPITSANIKLLQILDCLRYINDIPDTDVSNSVTILKGYILGMTAQEQKTMVALSMRYPPKTRALLGAILECGGIVDMAETLFKSLNNISIYKTGVSPSVLPNMDKWKIK